MKTVHGAHLVIELKVYSQLWVVKRCKSKSRLQGSFASWSASEHKTAPSWFTAQPRHGGTWCTSHVESGLCKGINLTTRFNMHLELFGRLALALSVGALLTPEQLQDGYTAVTAACPLEAMTNGNCKDLVHAP